MGAPERKKEAPSAKQNLVNAYKCSKRFLKDVLIPPRFEVRVPQLKSPQLKSPCLAKHVCPISF
jgi:hypothetical protein